MSEKQGLKPRTTEPTLEKEPEAARQRHGQNSLNLLNIFGQDSSFLPKVGFNFGGPFTNVDDLFRKGDFGALTEKTSNGIAPLLEKKRDLLAPDGQSPSKLLPKIAIYDSNEKSNLKLMGNPTKTDSPPPASNPSERQYEQHLRETGQLEALRRFKTSMQLLPTMPFQNGLAEVGKGLAEDRFIGESYGFKGRSGSQPDNPFYYQQKATEALRNGDTKSAEENFQKAIACAERIDPEVLQRRMRKISDEIEKADPNGEEIKTLKKEQERLSLLQASPALMRTAYADYLARTGRTDEAFQELSRAASNHLAVDDYIGRDYFGQLIDLSMHGSREMAVTGQSAALQLQSSDLHMQKAEALLRSGNPEDRNKAAEEFKLARDAAEEARRAAKGIDAKACAQNAQLLDKALQDELNKPSDKRDAATIQLLQEQKKLYECLSHLPALAALAQANAELGIPANGDQAEAAKTAKIRELLAQANGDHELPERTQLYLDKLTEKMRDKSYGERAFEWFKENSGTLTAIGVGAWVSGLTIWGGPGSALAGGAVFGAVAGSMVDHSVGNPNNVSGHIFEAAGGAGAALARRAFLAQTGRIVSNQFVAGGLAGAVGSAIEHVPILPNGIAGYAGEVLWSAGTGMILPRAPIIKRAPQVAPVFPLISNTVKEGAQWAVGQ
jgi:hypothetical protein